MMFVTCLRFHTLFAIVCSFFILFFFLVRNKSVCLYVGIIEGHPETLSIYVRWLKPYVYN